MKKYLIYIAVFLITFGIAYAIGYYVGYSVIKVKDSSQEASSPQKINTTIKAPQQDIEVLKQSLAKEQHKSAKLQQELKNQKQQVTQLEQLAANTSTAPKEEVIPATNYERTAFVTNLVHQFNADNASTEIVDVNCDNDFCFLTANVSAGTNTNPEIANLMRFLDKKKLPSYYDKVELLNVTKEEDYSEIKFSLNM